MRGFGLLIAMFLLAGCDQSEPTSTDFNDELRAVLEAKPEGTPRAYALIKNGMAGPDWLATIHGYGDNRSVCEMLIEPYNSEEETSVLPGSYSCEEIVAQ